MNDARGLMKWIAGLILFVTTGCMVGPNYRSPENALDPHWIGESQPCILVEEPPLVAWWTLFNDPLLEQCIELAALHNRDLFIAEAAILQARAIRQSTASALFPQIAADLSASRTYFSKNGPVFAIGLGQTSAITGLPFSLHIPQIQNLYNTLIDASWEIDLFGKTKRSIQAADANLESSIEQRNDRLITLLAEVAINYIELRSIQCQGELIEENIALLESSREIINKRLEVGYINRLDLERIEAEIAQSQAMLPGLCAQIYQTIYALSCLTGQAPEGLLNTLLPIQPLFRPPQSVAIGLRSDLVRRRPDIRFAERKLAAATANIGVAVASFFPSFTLNADIGLQSLSLRKLFQAKSLTWAIGGDINVPIYQGGNLVGNLHLAQAQTVSAAFQYQQVVLTALEEAESALIGYTEGLKAVDRWQEAVSRYEEIVFLSHQRLVKGIISLTDLLDSERQLNVSQQDLLTSKTDALIELVALFKALGGGWECEGG